MNWIPLSISLGAVAGALSRYYITLFWIRHKGDRFPHGTLFVNLPGAFMMGLIASLTTAFTMSAGLQTFLIVGFLGSYTTFSSYILDVAKLWRSRHQGIAIVYWMGSAVLGLLCVELGIFLGQIIISYSNIFVM
ncbi:fluoride efflux transporter CrcB [Oscillatoria sp. CS-180]|uniref:fluoride efflux transporter CrcB n=1 Tax=Oscillatoria sp. CS-180 TaxID=3021720 RepID=UPI00232B3759|nr:fluoride efflux transporter CrcB [Oscillatoria sp. CS-180]MDB9524926.1 fluoride efflux transporter CrcB [Oscillatoria sp. CS-180]